MIKVRQTIEAYEVNDKELLPGEHVSMAVESHGNYENWIVLAFPGGGRITVMGSDLRAAIENATNTNWPR